MRKDLALSVSYFVREPDDIEGIVVLRGIPIQLGVRSLDPDLLGRIKLALDEYNVPVNSIHTPKILPDRSVRVLTMLRDLYGARRFTIHPHSEGFENAVYDWKEPLRTLSQEGIHIGFENVRKTKAWFRDPRQFLGLKGSNFYLTLDVEHLDGKHNEYELLEDLGDRVLIMHVSERVDDRTAPYRHLDLLMPTVFSSELRELVLEYGRDHLDVMRRDYKAVKSLLDSYNATNADVQ